MEDADQVAFVDSSSDSTQSTRVVVSCVNADNHDRACVCVCVCVTRETRRAIDLSQSCKVAIRSTTTTRDERQATRDERRRLARLPNFSRCRASIATHTRTRAQCRSLRAAVADSRLIFDTTSARIEATFLRSLSTFALHASARASSGVAAHDCRRRSASRRLVCRRRCRCRRGRRVLESNLSGAAESEVGGTRQADDERRQAAHAQIDATRSMSG